jgi:hypothetical protein
MTIDYTGTFIEIEEINPAPKTRRFVIVTKKEGMRLGSVSWWGAWRKYVFIPEKGTLYEEVCLREIASFVETMMAAHREQVQREKNHEP